MLERECDDAIRGIARRRSFGGKRSLFKGSPFASARLQFRRNERNSQHSRKMQVLGAKGHLLKKVAHFPPSPLFSSKTAWYEIEPYPSLSRKKDGAPLAQVWKEKGGVGGAKP